jgi:hypothetical protein
MIYFILDEKTRFVKIGRSKNGGAYRLAQLQTGHASTLTFLGELDAPDELEQHLHEAFAAVRERGEWFRLSMPVVRFLLGQPCGPVDAVNSSEPEDVEDVHDFMGGVCFWLGCYSEWSRKEQRNLEGRTAKQVIDGIFSADETTRAFFSARMKLAAGCLPSVKQMDAFLAKWEGKDLGKGRKIVVVEVLKGTRLWGAEPRPTWQEIVARRERSAQNSASAPAEPSVAQEKTPQDS